MLSSRLGNYIRTCSCSLSSNPAVHKSVLRKLREETGLPFIKIKEALQETGNDPVRAQSWLVEKAAEQNWAKAQKLSSRSTSQGLVGILETAGSVRMVAVGCETESVAKNELFINLIHQSAAALDRAAVFGMITPESALSLASGTEGALSDVFTATIGRLGENIKANSFYIRPLDSPDTTAVSYLHRRAHCDIPGLSLGSIGSVVICLGLQDLSIGQMVAQHIVGSESSEDLLSQPLLQDEEITVGELCDQNNFKIVDFCRMTAQ